MWVSNMRYYSQGYPFVDSAGNAIGNLCKDTTINFKYHPGEEVSEVK